VTSVHQLAQNLRQLRLRVNFTQEQMAEVTGFEFKFYQKLENGRKAQIKVETVERLGKPFGLDAWHLLSPLSVFRRARFKTPRVRTPSPRGPRAKWKGIRRQAT
jgi:transcriptional regulator with XRE-family HTH domain